MERIKTLFRKRSTRLVAMMCVVALIIGLVPTVMFMRSSSAVAWDGSTKTQPSGSGTEADPYLIANGENLAWVAGQTNGTKNWSSGKYFKQTADIDLGNNVWKPIGTFNLIYNYYQFKGTYDGGNYNIYNIYVSSGMYVGLFGSTYGATIKNTNIASGSMSGRDAGGVAGRAIKNSKIIFCSNAATIKNNIGVCAGGIVGWGENSTIIACRNSGPITSVSNISDSDYSAAGGIFGNGSNSIACINTGSVSATMSGGPSYRGGIGYGGSAGNCYWLENKGASYIIGNGTSTAGKSTEEQLKNSDGKSTIINDMNAALKSYYDTNSMTDRYYWTYDDSKDGYPVLAYKMKSTANDLTVSAVPMSKVYDGQPVTAVTATTKSTGMGTLSEVKYNGSATAPSEPGTYSVTVEITEGVDYRAGTITLGSFTISKGTLSKDNFNDELGMPKNNSKVYDGEPVVITATLKSGLSGANNLSAVKYNGETTPPTDVGTYKATVEMKGSSAWNDGTVELGTFEITKATVSASDIDPGKINDFLYSMELSSNTPAANKYGYYSWENATSLATTRGPGEHTLIFTPKDTKNYDWSNIDGWTLNADSQTLSKTFTVNTVYVPERQIVVYFNKNAMK